MQFKSKYLSSIVFASACIFSILIIHQDAFDWPWKRLDHDQHTIEKIFSVYEPLIDANKEKIARNSDFQQQAIEKFSQSYPSLKLLNAIGQNVFLRPPNVEREQLENFHRQFLPYTTDYVFQLFTKLGDITSVLPAKTTYDYILINGATIPTMRLRLKALFEYINTKKIILTPQTKIIFLTGERDLFESETREVLLNPFPLQLKAGWQAPNTLPKMENEAAEWIWYQSTLPKELENMTITFVNAPKTIHIDANTGVKTIKRPTTFDTIRTWIEVYHPKAGSCLSISNQPYVYYQKITLAGYLEKAAPGQWQVDGAGPQEDDINFTKFKSKIGIYLDNLSRIIYTQIIQKQ